MIALPLTAKWLTGGTVIFRFPYAGKVYISVPNGALGGG